MREPRLGWRKVCCTLQRAACCAAVLLGGTGCSQAGGEPLPQTSTELAGATVGSSRPAQSSALCSLVGPDANRPGLHGTDLGYSVRVPGPALDGRLLLLFGDTWAKRSDACVYPLAQSDDLQASLPALRPAALALSAQPLAGADACAGLEYTVDDPAEPASWRRIRLFGDAGSRDESHLLDTSLLRTPVATFSDGVHVFGVFARHEPVDCASSVDCPSDVVCSADPAYAGTPIGTCSPHVALTADAAPALCRDDGDCLGIARCEAAARGVCLSERPFPPRGGEGVPSWYRDDPRRGVLNVISIASAFWPDRAEDYAVGFRFRTHRFANPAARTVANFDPEDPSRNDYRPGHHTLLMWGRPAFVGKEGFMSLPFLLYQPLAGSLRPDGSIDWQPRYFAGYDDEGKPVWSSSEEDAQPLYDADFDHVNQMTLSWLDALQRWVMFYGGSVPAWQVADPKTLSPLAPVHPAPTPGAIHARFARHPWGAGPSADLEGTWSEPVAVLTPAAAGRYLTCDPDEPQPDRPCADSTANAPPNLFEIAAGWAGEVAEGEGAAITAECVAGNLAAATQSHLLGDSAGHLYGANILEEWTRDATADVPDLEPDERAVDVYWNVSTWNPYQVIMIGTRLHAYRPTTPESPGLE